MSDDYIGIIKTTFFIPVNLELYLLNEAKQGNQQAKNKIVKNNARLVFSIAKGFYNNNHPLKDLIGYGMIGLLKAIDSYDSTKSKFQTWAYHCIRTEILKNIGDETQWNKKGVTIDAVEDALVHEMQISDYDLESIFKKYLTSREIKIIKLYFGFDAEAENTLQAIGKKIGLSDERIRQIKEGAIEKLKRVMQKQ